MLKISPTTPPPQSFGTVPSNSTATSTFTFSNAGNDCISASAISATPPFQPVNFSSFVLAPSASQPVTIEFNPNGAVGTFAETINVTASPARGDNSISVTGTSVPPAQLTLRKALLPNEDPGRFNLQIDGVTKQTNVGSGGSTGAQPMSVGSHTVGETGGTGTNLANYSTAIDCGAGPVTGTSTTVSLALGDDKTCTITNLGSPRLAVTKVVRPAGDPGLFNLQVDRSTMAGNVGTGGGTGHQPMSVGSHTVGETGGTGTNLANYGTAIDCGAGPVTGTSTTVSLALGDDKTCTITNLGPPRLAVTKEVQPAGDPGLFNLQIDWNTIAGNVSAGGTTGAQPMSVGSHTVGETGGGTNLANYGTAIDCGAGPVAGTSTTVSLALGDDKTCTITNLGPPRLTVNKVLVHPWTQSIRLFNLQIDGTTVRANVNSGSTGPQIVSPGNHTASETGGTGTSLDAFYVVIGGDCAADGTIQLTPGESKTCTITNYDNYGGCPVQSQCCEPGDGTLGCKRCSAPGKGC